MYVILYIAFFHFVVLPYENMYERKVLLQTLMNSSFIFFFTSFFIIFKILQTYLQNLNIVIAS